MVRHTETTWWFETNCELTNQQTDQRSNEFQPSNQRNLVQEKWGHLMQMLRVHMRSVALANRSVCVCLPVCQYVCCICMHIRTHACLYVCKTRVDSIAWREYGHTYMFANRNIYWHQYLTYSLNHYSSYFAWRLPRDSTPKNNKSTVTFPAHWYGHKSPCHSPP